MDVICREGDIFLQLCTILKLIMAEFPLFTDRKVCLGLAGFLGVLGVVSKPGVSGGLSGILKDLIVVVIGMGR